MNKLLLLLLLIPNLVMGEFDTQGALDAGYKQEEIDMYGFKFWYIKIDIYAKFHELKKLGYTKKEIKKSLNSLCENAKKIHESKEEEDRKKEWRSQCASLSGKAKSDFAAKKIYETCLEEGGYEK